MIEMAGLPKSIIKKYGITKKAWSVFRGRSTPKRSTRMSKKKGSRRARATGYAKKGYHKARGFLSGGFSLKSIGIGTLGLVAAQRFQPFGGAYKPAVDMVAVGALGGALHMGQHDMLTAGVKVGLATLVNSYLGGSVGNGGGDSL
jgi:hypothetical protein